MRIAMTCCSPKRSGLIQASKVSSWLKSRSVLPLTFTNADVSTPSKRRDEGALSSDGGGDAVEGGDVGVISKDCIESISATSHSTFASSDDVTTPSYLLV